MLRLAGRVGAPYSLRAYLIALCVLVVLPVILLAGALHFRAAALERAELEARLLHVAERLADDIDRDTDRALTVLRTLSTLPALAAEDWPTFYAQAKAAVGERAYVLVIDASLRQLVNTLVPYGAQPAQTGDPETARRILQSQQPATSDLFLSLIDKRPVFNIDLPILRDGQVRYILIWGQNADELLPVLKGQRLGAEWVTTILDRKGVVLARSRAHASAVGKTQAAFLDELGTADRKLGRTTNLDGEPVLRAIVRSKLSGWLASAAIPIALAEAPLRRSLWLWGLVSAAAVALAAGSAWLLATFVARQMAVAADAARALGRGELVCALPVSLIEANTISRALTEASKELAERSAHQRLLLDELSHRVKNVLAVVQAVAMRTLSGERTLAEARTLLMERVQALAGAHEQLVRTDWKGVPFRDITAAALAPFTARASLDGPDLVVKGTMVQTLALVLHELATNAAKHGALSDQNGRVSVTWAVSQAPEPRFKFRWEEKDGPTVKPPARKGFGSTLLAGAIPTDPGIKPRLSFEPGGFVYEIEAPLALISGA